MYKKTILIDLDGVLNTYEGAFRPDFIPPLKVGAFEFIQKLAVNYEVKIFTTRNKILASKWLIESGLESCVTDITNIKGLSQGFDYRFDACAQFKLVSEFVERCFKRAD